MVGKLILLLFCLIVAMMACPCATAASTGILAGTVTDLDGNGIAGVTVTLCRGNVPVSSVANNPQVTVGSPSVGPVGHYGFKGLTRGQYKVVVRKSVGSGEEYVAEQPVTVTGGTTVQDIVLDIPRTTPVPAYAPVNSNATDGFGVILAVLSIAGAVFILRRE